MLPKNWFLRYRKNIRKLLFFSLVLLTIKGNGQSVEDLKKMREVLFKEIQISNALLEKARSEQKLSTNKIRLLNIQIEKRKELINNYREQIGIVEKKIEETDSSINVTENQISNLKREYEKLIIENYKRRNNISLSLFFFSAETFNQAFQRYRMIQELNSYRKSQIIVLKNSQEALDVQKQKLLDYKTEVNGLLTGIENQSKELERERIQLQNNITSLKRKQSTLRQEIKEKERKEKELERQIVELIEAEAKKKVYSDSNFDEAKGKLMWPLNNGIVISYFGEHDHPVVKGLKIKNNGLDIQASNNRNVYCVYDGEVSRVVGIRGYNKAIIIRHGKFLTVYANLSTVSVNSGTKVKAGSIIGQVYSSDNENSDVLHFEIWEENDKINPLLWLKRSN